MIFLLGVKRFRCAAVLFQPNFSAVRNPRHHFPAQHDMRRLRPQECQRQCCVVRRHEHVRKVSGHRPDDLSADPNTRARKRFVVIARTC